MEESQIQKFYQSCNVFITGGTGFMGKVLIEKLLRSTEVSTLYILVREKKGKSAHSRIEDLFDDVLFDRLKKECPKFKHRIEAVPGDCSITGLGLSIMDRQKLISSINIIFHVAATVRFDENIKLAYDINVNGTKDILDLARETTNLKSLVHVSTAFANCPRSSVEERIYDCPVSYENVKAVIEKVSNEEAEMLTPRIIGEWPNTYVFTKALAESLIKDVGGGLPIGIFRPAVVISTYKEPMAGWIDNLYGPTGVVVGTISGILRVMPCDTAKKADIVPVDTCVAGLIASAWDVASKNCDRTTEDIPVYNYVSSTENSITWEQFMSLNTITGKQYPLSNSLWVAFILLVKNQYVYYFLRFLLHTFPALIVDTLLIITRNKPRMLQVYKKIHKFSEILEHFCLRSWMFSNDNVVKLWNKLNTTDRELFPLSITTVHWLLYFETYVKGVRKYLLKDLDSTLEAARKRNARFDLINTILLTASAVIICNTVPSILLGLFSYMF